MALKQKPGVQKAIFCTPSLPKTAFDQIGLPIYRTQKTLPVRISLGMTFFCIIKLLNWKADLDFNPGQFCKYNTSGGSYKDF